MSYYLIFDSNCSICNRMAETIQRAIGSKILAISIHDAQAQALLDHAYPNGWKYAPYLVEVNGSKVSASTGFPATVRLGLLLGPHKAWHVWRVARNLRITIFPEVEALATHISSRRRFLKTAAATATALIIDMRSQSGSAALAAPCNPCESVSCRFSYSSCGCTSQCGSGCPCRAGASQDRYNYYDCYDTCTGEYCYTRVYIYCKSNCLCV